jgi:hypothetical protein
LRFCLLGARNWLRAEFRCQYRSGRPWRASQPQRWVGLPTLSLPGGIPQAVRCQGRRAGPGDLHGVAPVSEVVGPVVCQGESRPYFESRTFRTDVSTWPILSPGDPIITRERDVGVATLILSEALDVIALGTRSLLASS